MTKQEYQDNLERCGKRAKRSMQKPRGNRTRNHDRYRKRAAASFVGRLLRNEIVVDGEPVIVTGRPL